MSHEVAEPPAQGLPELREAPFDTRIAYLKERFYFHTVLKESAINKHYIVEDREIHPDQKLPVFFYLKQTKYPAYEEHQFAKKYYSKFYNYCHSPFVKTDITKLLFIFPFENEHEKYFELVTIYEYGDSDRIDVENIEQDQILRFLRNICLLLEEVQKFNQLSHNNIYVMNMVLTNNELKLSGFKPVYTGPESQYKSWKVDFVKRYGSIRLDLFMVAIMWINFLGVDVNRVCPWNLTLDKAIKRVMKQVKSFEHVPKYDLLISLADASQHSSIQIKNVISEFDEFFVMEEIKAKQNQIQPADDTENNDNRGSNSFSHANFNNGGDTIGKISNMQDSIDDKAIKKSESKVSNPFTRAYKDSEYDVSNRNEENKRFTFDNHSASHRGKNDQFQIHGEEYSLRPKESHGDLASFHKGRTDGESFSDIDFDTQNFHDNKQLNKQGKMEERYSSLHNGNDSGLRKTSTQNYDDGRKIYFDDLDDGKRVSFRNPTLGHPEANLQESLNNRVKRESNKEAALRQNSLYSKHNSLKHNDFQTLGDKSKHLEKDHRGSLDNLGRTSDRASFKKNSAIKMDNGAVERKTSNERLSVGRDQNRPNQYTASDNKQDNKYIQRDSVSDFRGSVKEKESLKGHDQGARGRESLNTSLKEDNARESISKRSDYEQTRKHSKEVLEKVAERESMNKNSVQQNRKESSKKPNTQNEERQSLKHPEKKNQERGSLKIADKYNDRGSIKKSESKLNERESLRSNKGKEALREKADPRNSKAKIPTPERESIQSKQSNAKSEASHKQSLQPQGPILQNEMHQKLFGNKNSITNQVLNSKGSLIDKESRAHNNFDPQTGFAIRESHHEQNDLLVKDQRNRDSSASLKKDSYNLSKNRYPESVIEEKHSNPYKNSLQGHESNRKSSTPNKQSNVNSNQRMYDYDSRKNGLNHRLVEEALGKNNKKSMSKDPHYENNVNSPLANNENHFIDIKDHHADYKRTPSNSSEMRHRGQSDQVNARPYSRENSQSPAKQYSTPTPVSLPIDILPKYVEELPPYRPKTSSRGASPSRNNASDPVHVDEHKRLSEVLLTSTLNDSDKGRGSTPSDPSKAYNRKISNNPEDSRKQLIVDPRLLKPSASIQKSLKDSNRDVRRTFSNLNPEAVERSPLRKRTELEEEEEKSPINIVRSKIRDALKVELPEDKKQEIIERVQKEHEEELKKKFYRSWKQKERIAEKAVNQKILNDQLEENIRSLSEQKLRYKKIKDTPQFKKQRRVDDVLDIDVLEQEYAPIRTLAHALENKAGALNKFDGGYQDSANPSDQDNGRYFEPEESSNRSNNRSLSRNKKTGRTFSDLNQQAIKNFKLSPIIKRDKFFAYNHEHQVLKIPFRKIVEDFQRPIQEEIEGLKHQISHSPTEINFGKTGELGGMTAKNLKPNASAPAIDGQNNDLQNFFFKNQLKKNLNEDLESITVLRDLKQTSESKSKSFREESGLQNPRPSSAESVHDNAAGVDGARGPAGYYDDFIHMNEKPDMLVSELKDCSIFVPQNVFNSPDEVIKASSDFESDLKKLKAYFFENKLKDFALFLQSLENRYTGTHQVEVLKFKAFWCFYNNDIAAAKEALLSAMKTLKNKIGLNQKELYFAFIVINLAFLEFYCEDYEEAIEILKNEIFDNSLYRPYFYNNFLGANYYFLKQYQVARGCYSDQLKLEFEKKTMSSAALGNIFGLISKILSCLLCEDQKVESARFFQSLEEPFKNLVTASKGFDAEKHIHLKYLFEKLIFLFLSFGQENNYGGLLNFVLQRSSEKRLIDPVNNLTEEFKTKFCSHILFTCNYLKSKPNYGNFESNYVRYLSLAKKVISSCNLNVENLKINLTILFYKGVYYLNKGEVNKSKSTFDKCFQLYNTFFDGKHPELFEMLFQIGQSIAKLKKYDQAAFFFEKIISLNCPEKHISSQARRQLGKIYFRLQKYRDCVFIFKSYIESAVFKEDLAKSGKSVFKDICMLFVANEKERFKEFVPIREILIKKLLFRPQLHVVRYLDLFDSLSSVRFKTLPQNSRETILENFGEVLESEKLDDEDSLLKLMAFASTAYFAIIDPSQLEDAEKKTPMPQLLKDKDLSLQENARIVRNFVFDFVFMVVCLLPSSKSNERKFDDWQKQLDDLKIIKNYKNSNDVIIELIEKLPGISVDALSSKIHKLAKSMSNFEEPNNKRLTLVGPSQDDFFELPAAMKKAIDAYDVDKEFCQCSKEEAVEYGVTVYIEQFLRQIKNMLFLDISDNIGEYYRRFEAIITEKNWNWSKFAYVRDLFNFYLIRDHESVVDKNGFVQLLDKIFEKNELCIHDLKMIIMLIESFKNVEYMEIFVKYVDYFHGDLAAVIFNIIFMKNFNQKCSYIISSFYKKIYSYRFYHLENFPLMHCIGIDNILHIEKELDFRIYVRHRYECLNNPKLFPVFCKYISPNALVEFNLKYALYSTIVSLIKRSPDHHFEILQAFQIKLASCHSELPLSKSKYAFYFYDLYLIINLLDLKESPHCLNIILETMNFIEEHFSQEQAFHFAIFCSLAGNYFCKFKLFEASAQAKKASLVAMKRLVPGPVAFPAHVMEVDAKSLIFSVLSFLIIDYIELKQIDEAEIFLSKLLEYKFQNGMLDLEKLLLNFWFEFNINDYKQAADTLDLAQKLFQKLQLNEFLTKMFQATIHKMQYLLSQKTESLAEVERRRASSELSLQRLLNVNY